MGLVYAIRQISINKIIYIGSAKKYLSNRIATHKFLSNKYPDRKLYKYVLSNGGWENFNYEILEQIEDDNQTLLRNIEKEYIKQHADLCNLYDPISSREEFLQKKLSYKQSKEGCIKKPWMKRP